MSSLSTVEARLPPGFRFHPRDEELICDYLMIHVKMGFAHQNIHHPILIQVDLNKCEPWDIPENARVGGKEWYFYSKRDRKYATGIRKNRATISGYWKATGRDRPVFGKGTLILIGMRKTLVFYVGRAPKGRKTDWIMHEFRLLETLDPGPTTSSNSLMEDWVLCRVFEKSRSSEVGAGGKQETAISYGTSYEETTTSSPTSSSVLMQPCIKFDDDRANYNSTASHLEQVPCFSNFQTSPAFSLITGIGNTRGPKVFPTRIITPNSETTSCKPGMNVCSRFGEGSSDSSYLSEVGYLSSMWNNHFS